MHDVNISVKSGTETTSPESKQPTSSPARTGNLHADRGVKTIGLCIIVKNESKVILRCLESVRPIVDYVLVEDTGSTDGTQNLVREWLDRVGLPGEVHDEPWRDFAYNRSHALARLREQNNIDYALILDADDELVLEQGFDIAAFKSSLSQDAYDVELRTGASVRRYRRLQICSNRREFLYRGVLHEFIDTTDRALSWGPGKLKVGSAHGLYISSTRQGARNQDPDKYRKDARLLERALSEEKDKFLRSRHTFYLARSYRDAGEKQKALDNFLKRAELGFWADEVYISLFSAGQIQQELGKVDEALATFRRASDMAHNRAEALHAASRLCRESKRFAEGYEYARRGLAIPMPSGGLFVEPWRYDYGLLDELAVNAFWTGKYQESFDACQRLLREGKMPQQMLERIKQNAKFAADKLPKRTAPDAKQQSIKPVFIHAAPRTSSTWFWLKFRELPSTLCFYEPFNHALNWMTPERAARLGRDSWHSRHPKLDPYYREYTSMLRQGGGVKHFTTAMTMQWFLPEGGLHGELRPSEKDYLSLLVDGAREAGKTPVFGDCWSLGRIWPIKQTYDGFHIFQYRNLWQQWLSYVSYKRRGDLTFYDTTVDIIWRDDDPYFQYLVERGLKHAAEPWSGTGPKPSPLNWNRMYENIPRDAAKVRQIETLPEHHAFALFMGSQIYLYLNAQLCADLQADVTRMARDNRYRADIEQEIEQKTGLPVSFADIADVPPQTAVDFDQASVNWDEIREYARVAAEMLSKYGDPAQLAANANAFVDQTIDEMRRADAKSVAPAALPAKSVAPAVPAAPSVTTLPAAAKPASPGVKTIGLCMIVKNETKLIRRCLESVLPILDYILVVDTGSTDGTQQVIRDFLAEKKIAGAVIDEPWRDFAWNRSFSMAKLREVESVDYAFVIDADDTLEIDAGFDPVAFKSKLTADFYDVPVRHGSIAHHRPQLFSNRLPFSFKGVLHEYLETPPGELKRETLTGLAVRASTGGARSENPRKYQDDAAVLERALATETNPFLISRYTFYLAQSYRDCGEREKSLENYLKRVELGHWVEEIYVSLFEAGNLMAALDRPFDEVIATWGRASQLVPGRAEALHAASRYCRDKGKNAQGAEIARRGLELKQPSGLFVQPWIYDYGLLDEFSINAYWAGAYQDALDAGLKLLASDRLPASMVKRIAANARFAADKIPGAKAPNLGRFGTEDFIQQHALVPQRSLHSRVKDAPRVLLAILAKQKEPALPLYLECIEALDYPKSSIVLYIRTNNNTDRTEQILRDWVARVGHLYQSVEFDASNVAEKVEQYREHEWNATRFSVLGRIRNLSMRRAIELECDYYFVADVDNFIRPATLRELVALDLPIASPFLRSIAPGQYYSNFHAEIDNNGYFGPCDQYNWILNRHIRGVVEVPVVHCTYLVRTDVIPQLTYDDASGRYEYVVFSDSARKAGIPQYFDNRQIYGYITFGEGDDHHVVGGIDQARALLTSDLQSRPSIEEQTRAAKAQPLADHAPNSQPQTARTTHLKTLIFCTAFAKSKDKWDGRYRRWLQAIRSSELEYDNILIVDDGSPELPDWTDITITSGNGEIDQAPPPKILFYHFQEHLGRKALFDFPGWYRSFAFAGRYAQAHGFEKVIHIESDAFLISSRVQHYFNDIVSGWTTLWCPVHRLPESAIQVIAGDSIGKFATLQLSHPHEKIVGREFELQLPFDGVELRFTGDRYGERSPAIPRHADYAVQVKEGQADDYYWWLAEDIRRRDDNSGDKTAPAVRHANVVPRAESDLNIHLINLDRSTDRLAAFHKRNAHLNNVTRFPAIDALKLDREKLVKDGLVAPDCEYTPSALGCALSHMKLWRKAVTEHRPITIFEDDIAVSDHFEQSATEIMARLATDWDIIVWGYHLNPLSVWMDLLVSKTKLSGYGPPAFPQGEGIELFQKQDFRGGVARLLHSFGACAYSLSPRGANAALKYCLPLRKRSIDFPEAGVRTSDNGIDVALSGLYPSLKAFACLPPLVIPQEGENSVREPIDREVANG